MARRSCFESWGADPAERSEPYPCDRLVPEPDLILYRAVTVQAPPPVVFRWLCQLRVAPYSYDWLDNAGRRSPRQLVPGLEQLAVGQRFTTIFTLTDFEPDRHITVQTDHALFGAVAITYRVRAHPDGARLVAKLRQRNRPTLVSTAVGWLLPLGDLIMMRKQLRTLGALAERSTPNPASSR